jgi:predicted PurR-regulated permease PerM
MKPQEIMNMLNNSILGKFILFFVLVVLILITYTNKTLGIMFAFIIIIFIAQLRNLNEYMTTMETANTTNNSIDENYTNNNEHTQNVNPIINNPIPKSSNTLPNNFSKKSSNAVAFAKHESFANINGSYGSLKLTK